MAGKLTNEQVALLKEKHIAQLVTLMKDGSPHIAPLWIDTDGENILLNTEEGRVKTANMRRDPRVAISVFDPENAYTRVLNVRGTVTEITTESAREHIDDLAEKYTGSRPYAMHNPDKDRLLVKIRPDHVY